jgi:hypothetical protein
LKLLARVGHAPKLVRLLVVGSARFTIAAGHSATIGVRLTRRGRALLRRAGRRGLKLELAGTGVQSRTVLLR